jgi:hypothetical protein
MSHWQMSHDRQLMQLARSNLSAEQIAAKMKAPPKTIIMIARRLGIKLRPSAPTKDRRLKANK